ncbi:MAG: hypothetical protein ABWX94_01205 [Candidatus Saccharimonadales bacterium]
MSELLFEDLRGVLKRTEFRQNLFRIAETADAGQGLNGFYVQKHGRSANLHVSEVLPLTEKRTSRYHPLADDIVSKIGLYITAHAPKGLEPAFLPTKAELDEYQAMREHQISSDDGNQHLIRGIAAPRIMGGVSLFLIRESTTRVFNPAELDRIDDAGNPEEVEEALTLAGLNHALIRHNGSRTNSGAGAIDGGVASLFASPDFPDFPIDIVFDPITF